MDIRIYLKNLPSGTKLYSLVSGEVTFKEVRGMEIVVINHNHCEQLYHYTGRLWNSGLDGECLLFPSKELRDWDLFTKFKKGDIIANEHGTIAMFDSLRNGTYPDVIVYKAYRFSDGKIKVKTDVGIGYAHNYRLATKEEKDLFFNSLSEAGYSWNGEEVVSVFKKGDIVVSSYCISIVDHIADLGSQKNVIYYQACIDICGKLIINIDCGVGKVKDNKLAPCDAKAKILKMLDEAGYELKGDTVVKKKFDPQTFEPYQKVLVRSTIVSNWRCTFFSHMGSDKAICSGDNWPYCIPYENNEHLRGTMNDCDDFYKWWENK